jgi:hypothetical protein
VQPAFKVDLDEKRNLDQQSQIASPLVPVTAFVCPGRPVSHRTAIPFAKRRERKTQGAIVLTNHDPSPPLDPGLTFHHHL